MSSGHERERAGKEALAQRLREAEGLLAPGRWRLLDMETALREDGGLRGIRGMLAHVERGRGTKRMLVDLRRLATAPRTLLVARGSAAATPGDLVRVLGTKDGGLVGFDRSGTTVVHIRRSAFPAAYRVHREALAETYPMLTWRLSEDGRVLTEGRVPGRPLEDWPEPERIAVMRSLLDRAADAVGRGAERRPLIEQGSRLFGELSGSPRWARVAAAVAATGDTPWVLSHGDLTPENVIGRGPEDWAPIDYEDARPVPFFFDPLSVAVRDGAVRAALLGGALTAEWQRLLAAAGEDAAVLTPGVAMDVVALLAAEHHAREHGGDFAYTLAKLAPEHAE